MFGFDDETEAFGREPALLGIRLVFPPSEGKPGTHALRIESFSNDPRSLFLEIVSSYGPIVVEHGLAEIEANIHATYRFVTEQTMRFIGGFDTAGVEAPGGDEAADDERSDSLGEGPVGDEPMGPDGNAAPEDHDGPDAP
jgi:hypothetical protein